jgi:hypothetical protein
MLEMSSFVGSVGLDENMNNQPGPRRANQKPERWGPPSRQEFAGGGKAWTVAHRTDGTGEETQAMRRAGSFSWRKISTMPALCRTRTSEAVHERQTARTAESE